MCEIATCVKVTALKTVGDDLLIGVGGNAEVYTGGIKTSVIRIFKGAIVHGFVDVGNGQVVAYGGKQWARLTHESGEWRVKEPCVARLAPDWILDVTTDAKPSEDLFALTAHNNVLALQENTVIRCEEKCILYSGRFVAKDSIALGGTVFREIVIWRYEQLASDGDGDGDMPVLHRLRGHEGVIFCVDFSEERGLICSASDDRTARIWNVGFGTVDRWRDAVIIPTRQLHASTARVFRCVFTQDGHVVTGGEDSALCVWKIGECGEAAARWRAHSGSSVWCLHADGQKIFSGGGDCGVRSWSLDDDSNPVLETLRADFEVGDYPKVVRIWEGKHILCLSNEGYVISFDDQAGFNRLYHHDLLRGYGLLEANEDQMFLCTLEGLLLTLNLSTSTDGTLRASDAKLSKIHESKIFSIHILTRSILTCGMNGELRLAHENCIRKLSLPPCGEQRWVSCAKLVRGSTLIVGDRCGGLHVYGLGPKQGPEPLQSIRRAHGKRGVGDIGVSEREDGCRIRTVGRDGMVKEFSLSKGVKLEELSRVKMPIDWLERLIGETLTAGFHSSYFVIYDFIEERSVVSVPCGGSHRSWDLSHDSSTLVFVKDKQLCRARLPAQRGFEKAVVKSAFHPREVSVVHHFEISGRHFLVTAGEDTVIKIHEVDSMGRRSECLSLRSHISCVRSVKTLKMPDGEMVMVSAGGRAQVKVWRVTSPLQTTKGKIACVERASHMLKGDDKRRKKTWREADVVHDAEVRYMDIDVRPSRENGLVVTAACSDGVLRLLSVSQDLSTVTLLEESCRIDRCFLKLTPGGKHTMVSTSTDGISRLWTLQDSTLSFKAAVTTSQSGCNALLSCDGDALLTGGDDGSITVSNFSSAGKCTSFPRLHSGHVTGLSMVDQHVISCSVDQRIAIWKFDGADMSSVGLVDQLCTDVADIQAMAVWRPARDEEALVAVGGEGLAIYKCVF